MTNTQKDDTRIVPIIAAVFDLKDSTGMVARPESLEFTSQYLHYFLSWLSRRINELVPAHPVSSLMLLGDGAQVIWESQSYDSDTISHIVKSCLKITLEFRDDFSKRLLELIALNPLPVVLRCGIADGNAASVGFSIGNRNQRGYFGFCLALATRLQKVSEGISFAVSARMRLTPELVSECELVTKVSHIRGVGPEVILVLKHEYEELSRKSQRTIVDPGEHPYLDSSEGLLTHEDALEFADAINMRNTKDGAFLIVATQKLKVLADRYPNLSPILVEEAKVYRIGENRDRLVHAMTLLGRAIKCDRTYKRAYFNRACYNCLLAEKTQDKDERELFIASAYEDLSQVVSDEPTWRHWMEKDPDLAPLRNDSDRWKRFLNELPTPLAPLPT